MFIVRFKCPNCQEVFRKMGLMMKSDATSTCPKCGQEDVPIMQEDKERMELQEKQSCTKYG